MGWQVSPPPLSLKYELDPDFDLQGRPGLFHFKGNAYWQKPHRRYLRLSGRAAASAGLAYLARSRRLPGAAAFATQN